MKNFKMRIYKTKGKEKGNLEKELYFDNFDTMLLEYLKRSNTNVQWENPTLWKYNKVSNEYIRILGY